MKDDLNAYLENIGKPWWVLFYRLIWEQLTPITNSKLLDFGSGLGVTANHLAKDNDVIAIEPNTEMVRLRICENNYEQIVGNIDRLREQPDNSFDLVVCHNVLEYAEERKAVFKELYRVLRPGGTLSIVKHHHAGRILAKVVFENNLDEALTLLNGQSSHAAYFGKINYYDMDDIREWIGDLSINVEKVLGVRTFFALHSNNETRYDPTWQAKMFELEMKVSDMDEFKSISFFHHILFKKFPASPHRSL